MKTIKHVENILDKDIPFNYRAHYVTFMGDFEVLEAHVAGLKGRAYVYAHGYGNGLTGRLNAIAILPSGVTLSDGKTLSSEGRACEILHSGWISTP